jgi:hypothetical protein
MSDEGKVVLMRSLRNCMNKAAILGIVDGPDVFGVLAKLLAESIGRMKCPAERAARVSEILTMIADAVRFEAGDDAALAVHEREGNTIQ